MQNIHVNFGTSYEREKITQKTIARARKAIKKIGDPNLAISTLSLQADIVNRDELNVSMKKAAFSWLKKFICNSLNVDEAQAREFIYKHNI